MLHVLPPGTSVNFPVLPFSLALWASTRSQQEGEEHQSDGIPDCPNIYILAHTARRKEHPVLCIVHRGREALLAVVS
jgi:hypothetical protein